MDTMTPSRPGPLPAAPARPAVPVNVIERVAQGDKDAFTALYERTAPRVYGIALRTLRSPAQAEEVTQEVLTEIWCTAASYRPDRGSALAWILTIAHHRAVDRVRSTQAAQARERRLALRDACHYEPVGDHADAAVDAATVRRALARLTHPRRESLVLAYYGGYTQREIAQALDVPLGTVKTRIRDGLRQLRAELGDPH